jgi:hypothetical protein
MYGWNSMEIPRGRENSIEISATLRGFSRYDKEMKTTEDESLPSINFQTAPSAGWLAYLVFGRKLDMAGPFAVVSRLPGMSRMPIWRRIFSRRQAMLDFFPALRIRV